MPHLRLSDRVAIITGGSGGIGAATARRFLSEGARVFIADVLVDEGNSLVRELGSNARFFRLDVSSEAEWPALIHATETAFGPVSILVNNAGIVGPQAPVDEYPADE